MKKIAEWNGSELELENEFDEHEQLQLTILDNDREDANIWINKESAKRLIEHIQSIL